MMSPTPSDSPDITVTKRLTPQRRPNSLSEIAQNVESAVNKILPTVHSYEGEDHPTMVTDTNPADDASSEFGDKIITIDEDDDLNSQELEGDWGKVMFLDSKHDLSAAWESNRMFLV